MQDIDVNIIIQYSSPDTNLPNERLTAVINIRDLLFEHQIPINFREGGYIMSNELEDEYTKIIEVLIKD